MVWVEVALKVAMMAEMMAVLMELKWVSSKGLRVVVMLAVELVVAKA